MNFVAVKHFCTRIALHVSTFISMGFYECAADVIEKIFSGKGTINGLVYSKNVRDKKRMMKFVCDCLKYKDAIEEILERSTLLRLEKLSLGLGAVLVYEYLFKNGKIKSPKLAGIVNRNKTRLRSELIKLKAKRGVKENAELITHKGVKMPKYVRINTLLTDVNSVKNHFRASLEELKGEINLCDISAKNFCMDKDIPELMVFNESYDLHENELYKLGKIIIQDKASCFPAIALYPPADSIAMDICAAPGNKTSHLSAIMQNKGKILSIERDAKRCRSMRHLLSQRGCKNVEILQKDFLEIDPNSLPYRDVEYMLLDPTCSGSGIVRLRNKLIFREDDSKIPILAKSQKELLIHALSFPNLKRLVYSTCSVNIEENEEVVKHALELNINFKLKHILPFWKRRGEASCPNFENLVRTLPGSDKVSGFFVACFEAVSR